MEFKNLNICIEIQKALQDEKYSTPTPIQEQAIPAILSGRDLLGLAQTGTGKTAAFAIPCLQLLQNKKHNNKMQKYPIRALVITPTRELALQIYESFNTYGKYLPLKSAVIFGGVSQNPQEEILKKGVDILVATPGRLHDLMNQGLISLSEIQYLILDEADRMLDMGFIQDIKKILKKVPEKRQTLLFSATMSKETQNMADSILKNPIKVQVTPVSSTVDAVKQMVYFIDKENKKNLLIQLLKEENMESVLVFTKTKHGADRLVKQLGKEKITASAIHGDKSQGARQKALGDFKNKTLKILIATDIAARGIDIDELSHVINYDIPNIPETYVHRIGRTGRAGQTGIAISFCDHFEKEFLKDITKLIRKQIPIVEDHPYPIQNTIPVEKQPRPEPRNKTKESGKRR